MVSFNNDGVKNISCIENGERRNDELTYQAQTMNLVTVKLHGDGTEGPT